METVIAAINKNIDRKKYLKPIRVDKVSHDNKTNLYMGPSNLCGC
jgi:hypothetical protein